MSKVFSFRLDENNSREVQALQVIHTWTSQGYSLRHITTEALINLGDNYDQRGTFDHIPEHLTGLIKYIHKSSKSE